MTTRLRRFKKMWNPQFTPPDRPHKVAGVTAADIVGAAMAIANDEWCKKHARRDERIKLKHRAAIAAVSLQKMPWD